MASQRPVLSIPESPAAVRRAIYLDILQRRIRPGSGSSSELLRSRRPHAMPDLKALLPGVRFVVVGGTATSLYMPARTTDDVDVLIKGADAPAAAEALRRAGARLIGSFSIGGTSWRLPDATDLDVLTSEEQWVDAALACPNHDAAGLPIIALPYLVLLKLEASRGVDIGDLSRMLGGADESALTEVRATVARYLPDAVEDVERLIQLGRLEFSGDSARAAHGDDASSTVGKDTQGVLVREHARGGRRVRAHRRRRPQRSERGQEQHG